MERQAYCQTTQMRCFFKRGLPKILNSQRPGDFTMKRQYLEDISEFVPGSSVLQQFKYVCMLLLLGVPAW
jgi:hypothetical protein